jgi:hypothetical protein
MKELKDFISESNEYKMLDAEFKYRPNSTFFYFSPVHEMCGFCSDEHIYSFEDDGLMSGEDVNRIIKLKVGEIYSPDNGENQYVRIKK